MIKTVFKRNSRKLSSKNRKNATKKNKRGGGFIKRRKTTTRSNKRRKPVFRGGMFQAMQERAISEAFKGKGIPYTDVPPFHGEEGVEKIRVLVFGPGVGSKRPILEEMKKSDPRFDIHFLDAPEGEGYVRDELVYEYITTNPYPHVIIAGSRSSESVRKIIQDKLISMYSTNEDEPHQYYHLQEKYKCGVLLLGPDKNFRGVCDHAPKGKRYVVVYGTEDTNMRLQYVRWGVLSSGQHELIEMEGFGHDLTKTDSPNPWIGGELLASLIYRAKIDC